MLKLDSLATFWKEVVQGEAIEEEMPSKQVKVGEKPA